VARDALRAWRYGGDQGGKVLLEALRLQEAGRTDVGGGERDVRLGPVVYVTMEGWRPVCDHYADLYHRDFPMSKGRWQRMTWWGRVRKRPIPPKFDWPTTPAIVLG
jgi:hypothetical protein